MNECAKKAYYAPQRNEVSEFRNGSEADIAPVNVMSALGQKQTSRTEILMSALPPKADIAGRRLDVRFVPEADINS
jgi:hypothetical protein